MGGHTCLPVGREDHPYVGELLCEPPKQGLYLYEDKGTKIKKRRDCFFQY
jgi:hypothetical protein